MRLRLFIFFLLISFVSLASVFPLNINPCTATPLGTLNAVPVCPNNNNVFSTPITVFGTNNYSITDTVITAGIQNCHNSAADMSEGIQDLWYDFYMDGTEVEIIVTPDNNSPTPISSIGLAFFKYQGSCVNLIPIDCKTAPTGTSGLTFRIGNLKPGEKYYLQVSSLTNTTSGAFKLLIANRKPCNTCTQSVEIIPNIKPVFGFYEPNTTVTFKCKISGYKQFSGNALKAVMPKLGNAWIPSSFSYLTPASVSGTGAWTYNFGVALPGFAVGQNCFMFTPSTGGSSGDLGGVNDQWEFIFSVKTISSCTLGTDLSIDLYCFSDLEITNGTSICSNDPEYYFKSKLNCCLSNTSTITPSPENCTTYLGSINAANNSTFANQNYQLYDNEFYLYTQAAVPGGSTTFGNLTSGNYNIIYFDPNNPSCKSYRNVVVDKSIAYTISQNQKGCVGTNTNGAKVSTVATAGVNVFWDNATVSNNQLSNASEGIHTVVITFSGCYVTDSIYLVGNPYDDATLSYQVNNCIYGALNDPYVATPGGIFTVNSQPSGANTILNLNGGVDLSNSFLLVGNYDIVYNTNGACPSSSSSSFTIDSVFNSNFAYAQYSYCKENNAVLPVGSYTGGGYFQCLNCTTGVHSINLDGITGQIFPAQSDTGMFIIQYSTVPLGGQPTSCDRNSTVQVNITSECSIGSGTSIPNNAISPNGDGLNDTWYITGANNNGTEVSIFNRWGELVYKSTNYSNTNNPFSGKKSNGEELVEGTYYYIIKGKNFEQKKGWIEITK